jgi:hypothetical protein
MVSIQTQGTPFFYFSPFQSNASFPSKAFELGKQSSESVLSGTQSENLLKKTGNFVNLVSKALNTNNSSEPAYIRARQDADEADKAYRIAVRRLDRHRLALEERIEDTLKILQRWESERLRAVKTGAFE